MSNKDEEKEYGKELKTNGEEEGEVKYVIEVARESEMMERV